MLSSFSANDPLKPGLLDHYDLTCYKMRSKTVSHSDYNIWVITNKAALDEHFISDSCAGGLNFEDHIVIALKLETNSGTYKVSISRITVTPGTINVYFNTKRLKIPVEEGSPLEMAELDRGSQLKQIKFYHGDLLVRTVPVVSVY
jgi:hypothetical protein